MKQFPSIEKLDTAILYTRERPHRFTKLLSKLWMSDCQKLPERQYCLLATRKSHTHVALAKVLGSQELTCDLDLEEISYLNGARIQRITLQVEKLQTSTGLEQ